jgi:hypothetical protein
MQLFANIFNHLLVESVNLEVDCVLHADIFIHPAIRTKFSPNSLKPVLRFPQGPQVGVPDLCKIKNGSKESC